MFGLTKKEKQERNARHNSSFAGRAATTKQYHVSKIAPITELDDVNGKALEMIWNKQKGICVCCGKKFSSLDEAEIDHISAGWLFRSDNIQLICGSDNRMKKGLTLPFAQIKAQYGKNWLQLVREYPEMVQKIFFISDKKMKSIVKWAEKKSGK